MNDLGAYFKGKKITVMGLGLLGRGVGDSAYLARAGAELIVTDMKPAADLKESLQRLSSYPNITYVLGEHRMEDFIGRDIILKAAGVPLDSPYIAAARKDGAKIAMSGALFAKLSGVPVIGVTGTRGKSTVTHMIDHVLRHATEGAAVLLGGNVRGVSNLELLERVEEGSLAVMELDSWQLQGFGEERMSPHISVFTNFMEDHMNYYKGDMEAYFADKANIFRYQEQADVLVTTRAVFERAEAFMRETGEELTMDVRLVDASILPEDCLLSMPGEHNRLNAALAMEALRATSLTDEEIVDGLASFPGVPGRLEYLGTIDGVKVYNDNNATTPQATSEGLRAVADGKNIVLIAGGADKNIDLAPLVSAIGDHAKAVVLLPGTGTERLRGRLDARVAKTLEEAVEEALRLASPGDVVLFSPGFASFGIFKNEYDRNDQFVNAVHERQAREL
ncbi:MAG TPA: UDP-N-acetylmuramoyl-L-alanine--D-glutamate ligase [Candidatus Paceibacterota bacterium]|nr:UDP-N-acetylmuramoyl-L-alanine--D-glutamate ligase [Candidatus Paceibacterota bacterium]